MLARSPDVLVMARNSSFVYGGRPVDVREVGSGLGVDYVLEGSVRREGDKLRIVAQLNDAATGEHLWANRFDEAGTDPWVLQDDVAGRILNALTGETGQLRQAQFREAWAGTQPISGNTTTFCAGWTSTSMPRTPGRTNAPGASGGRDWRSTRTSLS